MNSNVRSAVLKPQHQNAESQELPENQSIEHLPESDLKARSAATSASISTDSTLSKWELGDLVGTGEWSRTSTYVALDMNTGELFAVKQVDYSNFRAETLLEKNKIQRMRRDLVLRLINIVSRLDHSNVVRYIGDRLEGNIHSISMEYVFGGSLRDMIRIYGKLGKLLVSNFTHQILLGLTYLHEQNVVHRALTAVKILISPKGSCKISWSFKMARIEDAYMSGANDAIEGARYLLAPEVVQSQGSGYTAKADIWSLGCIVLELFSGRRLFSKEDMIGSIYKLGTLSETPPIPGDVITELDATALAFIQDCWTLDPSERPTAETLLRSSFTFKPSSDSEF